MKQSWILTEILGESTLDQFIDESRKKAVKTIQLEGHFDIIPTESEPTNAELLCGPEIYEYHLSYYGKGNAFLGVRFQEKCGTDNNYDLIEDITHSEKMLK